MIHRRCWSVLWTLLAAFPWCAPVPAHGADRGDPFASETGPAFFTKHCLAPCSPHFLFMVEAERGAGGPRPVDEFELANRLSFFLWNTMPDTELFFATAVLPSGEKVEGVEGLKKILVGPRKEQFLAGLAEKMMIYALGRGPDPADIPAVQAIVDAVMQNQDRSRTLLRGIIASPAFNNR